MANQTIECGFCALCKRALLSPEGICTLSDGNQICSKCIRRLRVMLPLNVSADSNGIITLKDDPMMKLNLAEAKQKMQNVTAYTEKLRANYQNANAVFAVDQVQTEKDYIAGYADDPESPVVGFNCPNCGAPLPAVGARVCVYCGTAFSAPVDLGWMLTDAREG